jgi:hypothetical protein
MFTQVPVMYMIILACPVELAVSDLSQVYTKHQARYTVLCIITPEDGASGPQHVVYH